MQKQMFFRRNELKVLYPVIGFNAVNVMNLFASKEFSTKKNFHYITMLLNRFALSVGKSWSRNHSVTV